LRRVRKTTRAMSNAVSMVIITAATIVLVLVASNYAYQVLEHQRGASEFDAVKKSFIAFDDAVRDVALDEHGSRSAHFTVSYGMLELVPNSLPLHVTVNEYFDVSYSDNVGYVRYTLPSDYVNLGSNYKEYLLGDNKTVVNSTTEDLACALIDQESSQIRLTFYYRVRILGPNIVQVNGSMVGYIEILIIKLTASQHSVGKGVGRFYLIAKNVNITTESFGPYDAYDQITVNVTLGGVSTSVNMNLNVKGQVNYVVFNFVIAEISVSIRNIKR